VGQEINLNNNNKIVFGTHICMICQRKSKNLRKYDKYCVNLKKVRDRKTQDDMCI
jgi:hypothetical protein